MNIMDCLRLQVAWGADEFLLDAPQDRRAMAPVAAVPVRVVPRVESGLPAGPAAARELAAGCGSLAALEAALSGFTGCALQATATHTVFGSGPERARLMMIGDAPGADEDRDGVPFAGPAGGLLDKMLGSIGLHRDQIRLTNVLPWRPPGDRNPSEAEIAVCLPFAQRHIALVQPELVVLLGAIAARALLPEGVGAQGIRRLRGGWRTLDVPAVRCFAMYHPAYLLHLPSAKREAWHDLLSLRGWLEARK